MVNKKSKSKNKSETVIHPLIFSDFTTESTIFKWKSIILKIYTINSLSPISHSLINYKLVIKKYQHSNLKSSKSNNKKINGDKKHSCKNKTLKPISIDKISFFSPSKN